MAIDPNTGLPKLPEGEFWRIAPPSSSPGYAHILRMRAKPRRFRKGTRNVVIDSFPLHAFELTQPYRLREAAQWILGREERERKDREARNAVYGDYPPKRLTS